MRSDQKVLFKSITRDTPLLHQIVANFLDKLQARPLTQSRKAVIKKLADLHNRKKLSPTQQETILRYSMERLTL